MCEQTTLLPENGLATIFTKIEFHRNAHASSIIRMCKILLMSQIGKNPCFTTQESSRTLK